MQHPAAARSPVDRGAPGPPARLLVLALAVALLGAGLVLAGGGPAAAQGGVPSRATVEGTAANKWVPDNVTIRPGGTVTFTITGGVTHPVVSGDGSNLEGDNRFDDSDCGLQQMSKVGDSCQVRFPRAGTFPYFCQVHLQLGMKGVVNVGTRAATTTTAAGGGEVGGSVVEPPSAASPPSAGRPAIYWAGWGLLALGGLLALTLIGLYVRFSPGFNRPKE